MSTSQHTSESYSEIDARIDDRIMRFAGELVYDALSNDIAITQSMKFLTERFEGARHRADQIVLFALNPCSKCRGRDRYLDKGVSFGYQWFCQKCDPGPGRRDSNRKATPNEAAEAWNSANPPSPESVGQHTLDDIASECDRISKIEPERFGPGAKFRAESGQIVTLSCNYPARQAVFIFDNWSHELVDRLPHTRSGWTRDQLQIPRQWQAIR